MRVFFAVLLVSLFFISCTKQPDYPEPLRVGNDVAVDLEALRPEVPVFFTYRHQGKRISFFVVKTGDSVLSFLDACVRCYPSRKGYRVDSGALVCRKCNVSYSVSGINKGVGSCLPIRITGTLQGGKYLIPVSVLEGMADKF